MSADRITQSDLIHIHGVDPDPELLVPKQVPGTSQTPAGIIVPDGHMATPAGLLVQKRDRFACRYCGAVFGLLKGVELHEIQCGEQTRNQWTAAAINGPASGKTPAELIAFVDEVMAEHAKRPRRSWTESGDPRA